MSEQQTQQEPAHANLAAAAYDALSRRFDRLDPAQVGIRERLTRLETRSEQFATKADLAAMEATLLKWFVGTAVALASLAFAAARFLR